MLSVAAFAALLYNKRPDGVVGTFNGYTLPASMEFGVDSRLVEEVAQRSKNSISFRPCAEKRLNF